MSETAAPERPQRLFRRLRFVLVILLCWAGFYFIANAVLVRGFDRPVVIFSAVSSLLAAPLMLLVLCVGTWLAGKITGSRQRETLLAVVCIGLALWSFSGGTMQEWLIQSHPTPGAPRSAPYAALFPDYVLLLIGICLAATSAEFVTRTSNGRNWASHFKYSLRQALALNESRMEKVRGLGAVLLIVVVAALLLTLLSGPNAGHVRRGQVLFATAAAFAAGAALAHRWTGARHPLWYWLPPLLAGALGVLVALAKPDFALPADYRKDVLPAWALVRPLPIEMVGAGVAAAMLMLRTMNAVSGSEASADSQK